MESAADRRRAVDFVALAGLPGPAVAADLQLELVAVDRKSMLENEIANNYNITLVVSCNVQIGEVECSAGQGAVEHFVLDSFERVAGQQAVEYFVLDSSERAAGQEPVAI